MSHSTHRSRSVASCAQSRSHGSPTPHPKDRRRPYGAGGDRLDRHAIPSQCAQRDRLGRRNRVRAHWPRRCRRPTLDRGGRLERHWTWCEHDRALLALSGFGLGTPWWDDVVEAVVLAALFAGALIALVLARRRASSQAGEQVADEWIVSGSSDCSPGSSASRRLRPGRCGGPASRPRFWPSSSSWLGWHRASLRCGIWRLPSNRLVSDLVQVRPGPALRGSVTIPPGWRRRPSWTRVCRISDRD